jgi:glutaminase
MLRACWCGRNRGIEIATPAGSHATVHRVTTPRTNPIERYLQTLLQRFRNLADGQVATYIPELGRADPNWFGICLATMDGHVYEIGDAQQRFTIQSISKPFVYGLALEDRGKPEVLKRIGVEPTGDAFNQISLEPDTGRPRNPMINAGAIAAAALVAGYSIDDRWNRILALFSLYTGRDMALNEAVYRSERDTGHRNRAISHMLRNAGILTDDPEPDLDLYFRQCSIDVTARDLAIMAATLAAGGLNPVTRERALAAEYVDEVLSVMATCGMYDYAGEWFYRVGFPAKSGVSGGVLAVLPGQFGVGVFSPPLDARGNSVRGVAVCTALSDDLELHSLRAPRIALSALRTRSTLVRTRSKRVRSAAERERLESVGERAVIYRLQGDLSFAAMELVARRCSEERHDMRLLVLDLGRVREFDTPAAGTLRELLGEAIDAPHRLALVGLQEHPRLQRLLDEARVEDPHLRFPTFDDFDSALEWCEDELLKISAAPAVEDCELDLAAHELLRGLEPGALDVFRSLVSRREFVAGERIVRDGDAADAMYLIVRGELSVVAEDNAGRRRRLSTLSSGMGFGEAALIEAGVRTATVRADRAAVCYVLERSAIDVLRQRHPSLALQLLGNVLRSTWRIVERLSREQIAYAQ